MRTGGGWPIALQSPAGAADTIGVDGPTDREEPSAEQVLAALPEAIVVFDRSRRVVYLSPGASRLVGWHREILAPRPFSLVAPPDRRAVLVAVRAVVDQRATEARCLARVHTAGGDWVWLELTVAPLSPLASLAAGGRLEDHLVVIGRPPLHPPDLLSELDERAHTDALTGALNRRGLHRATRHTVSAGERPFLLAIVDVDDFKHVNDAYGHVTGDAVLVEVSRRIQAILRDDDALGRYGGDEFIVVIHDIADRDAAERVCERMLEALREPMDVRGLRFSLTVSAGAVIDKEGSELPRLIAAADVELYRAKRAGKDRASIAPAS